MRSPDLTSVSHSAGTDKDASAPVGAMALLSAGSSQIRAGSVNASKTVAPGMPYDHSRPGFYCSGTELRAGDVHYKTAGQTQFLPRALQMIYHPVPDFWGIMRAVNPHTVHSVGNEVAHQRIVICGR